MMAGIRQIRHGKVYPAGHSDLGPCGMMHKDLRTPCGRFDDVGGSMDAMAAGFAGFCRRCGHHGSCHGAGAW